MAASAFRRLQDLADAAEPALRRAYQQAIEQIQKATSALRIAAAIERGDIAAVNVILQDAHLERELRAVADVIRRLTLDAARLATLQVAPGVQAGASMNQTNPAAVRAAEQQAARMVTRVSQETKKAIRQVITQAVSGRMTAQQAARQIVPLIGLTAAQAKAVQRYRRELEAAGKSAADIEKAVARYTQQLLRQRARTIARTETQAAANAGQQAIWRQAQRNGMLPLDAKRRWIVTSDDRLCPNCAPLDGQTVGIDEPFQTVFGAVMNPPLHPNCLPADALVAPSGRISAVSERPFDGNLIVIHTASRKRLACTPNHPILTPSGWRSAHLLDVGNDVISQVTVQGVFGRNENREYVPSRFHDVAEAFGSSAQVSGVPVPMAAEDFHGDGFSGEVAVIWTDRALVDGLNAAIEQESGYFPFHVADVQAPRLDGQRVLNLCLDANNTATCCAMCGCDLMPSLFGRHLLPLEALGFALPAPGDASLVKPSAYAVSIDADFPRDGEFRTAGEVLADQIVRVDVVSTSGHMPVFNMETSRGWYVANGIVTHNCRCAMGIDAKSLAVSRGARSRSLAVA